MHRCINSGEPSYTACTLQYIGSESTCAMQAGEVITLESWINGEWMTGVTGNGRGMFPVSFVEIVEPLPSKPAISACITSVLSLSKEVASYRGSVGTFYGPCWCGSPHCRSQ